MALWKEKCQESCTCKICEEQVPLDGGRKGPLWVEKEQRRGEEEADKLRAWVLRHRLRCCRCRCFKSFLHPHFCPQLGITRGLKHVINEDLRHLEELFLMEPPPRRVVGFDG